MVVINPSDCKRERTTVTRRRLQPQDDSGNKIRPHRMLKNKKIPNELKQQKYNPKKNISSGTNMVSGFTQTNDLAAA
jgi:hypothetical protein